MPGELGWFRELVVQFKDGTREVFEISRKPTGTHIPAVRNPAPWTKLGYNKCPCCPIPGDYGACPAALSLQLTLDRLRHRTSVEMVQATAIDEQGRSETATVPLQTVGGVLVSLAVFASECPVGRRVKPHLAGLSPFINSNELIAKILERMVAAAKTAGVVASQDIEQIVRPLHEVFIYLLSRVTGGEKPHHDAIPNSLVRMDAIAQTLAYRAGRLHAGLEEQIGWTARRKREAPGLLDKIKGLFGA